MASNFPTAYVKVASQTYVLQHISIIDIDIDIDIWNNDIILRRPSFLNDEIMEQTFDF